MPIVRTAVGVRRPLSELCAPQSGAACLPSDPARIPKPKACGVRPWFILHPVFHHTQCRDKKFLKRSDEHTYKPNESRRGSLPKQHRQQTPPLVTQSWQSSSLLTLIFLANLPDLDRLFPISLSCKPPSCASTSKSYYLYCPHYCARFSDGRKKKRFHLKSREGGRHF